MTIPTLPPLLADSPSAVVQLAALDFDDFRPLYFLLLIVLLVVNALFVAAKCAITKVHASQLEDEVESERKGATLALAIAEKPAYYLAICQIGIALSTILLGAAGEPVLSSTIAPIFETLSMSADFIRPVSFVISIAVLVFFYVIVSEQIPRIVAGSRTVPTAIASAYPLRVLYPAFAGPVWLIKSIANVIVKYGFRIDPNDAKLGGPTADELRLLVEETGRVREVTETEHEILRNALELNELSVRDILTPRNEVVVLDIHKTFRENLEIALESKHTRFPLVDGHLDKTLGLIHIKDLLREMQRDSLNLFAVKRELMRVSEMLPLDEMLKLFLAKRAHMALVVDEFGGSVGLVMLDDVLDQVVGEILDEFDDEEEVGFRRVSDEEFEVEGWLPLHELADEVEELNLEDPDVSTIGGYLISQLGRIPEPGERTIVEGYEANVISADERTVQQIRFVKLEDPGDDESGQDRSNGDKGRNARREAV